MNLVIRILKAVVREARANGGISPGVVSVLRTVVPAAWAAAIVWASAQVDWLPEAVQGVLTSPDVVALVVTGVLTVWYAGWRRIESYVPAWLTRLVLGSNQAPKYDGVGAVRD